MEAPPDQSGVEVAYVVVELEGAPLPMPGSTVQLMNLGSAAPTLELADGTRLVGEFEETLGSQMVFLDDMDAEEGARTVQLLCHTDKKIRFTTKGASAAEDAF